MAMRELRYQALTTMFTISNITYRQTNQCQNVSKAIISQSVEPQKLSNSSIDNSIDKRASVECLVIIQENYYIQYADTDTKNVSKTRRDCLNC